MKQLKTTVLLIATLLFVTSCGITQELDESLTASKELETTIKEQKTSMKELLTLVEKIIPSFEKDLEIEPETGLFIAKEGALYKNFTAREDMLTTLKDGHKELDKLQKEIQRISDKNAVDVDHNNLNLISSSLKIISNNYDSLIMYLETGFTQEKELYLNLPVDNLDNQFSMITRTYGSVTMVGEEAISNMNYTLKLITDYQKQAASPKK